MLRRERFWLFALGVLGGYAGLSGCILRTFERSDSFVAAWFAISSLGVMAVLAVGHRAIRRKA